MVFSSPALVLLSGNSEKTKTWIAEVARTLQPLFSSITVQHYNHWGKGHTALIDVDIELAKLKKTVAQLKHYALLGKSAGCLVILKGIREERLHPAFCVFLGLPVAWAHANNHPIDTYIDHYKTPTLFLQKDHDPAIGADELASLLREKRVLRHHLISVPGNDHHYEDLYFIQQSIQAFMKNYGT